MPYDPHDTIVAIASAAGGAARGIVRLSGPRALECLAASFTPTDGAGLVGEPAPRRVPGAFRAETQPGAAVLVVPGVLFLWPDERSYTRQPSAEFHMTGCAPLLGVVADELCRRGARPAEPGEFTLRAFLAGRIDLTQAEGVLGVVDAFTREDLEEALDQLAGGLSRPLHALREQLLTILAELEAGLDFADEAIEFIGRDDLQRRIAQGEATVNATVAQLGERDRFSGVPRVALTGPPNVGKSSLFNVLVERFGSATHLRSLVSSTPGATRDYVSAQLNINGVRCELVDSAGFVATANQPLVDALEVAAQDAAAAQRRVADLRLRCMPANDLAAQCDPAGDELLVATKSDLTNVVPAHRVIACSSETGAGLGELAAAIRQQFADSSGSDARAGAAATAARSAGALREAGRALAAARRLVDAGSDELLAAELRVALHAVGEITGAVCADDVLDRVFSQFCIGK